MTKEYIIVNGVPILRSLIAETAKELPYDNTTSQLQATNSQDAIDELSGKIEKYSNIIIKQTNNGNTITFHTEFPFTRNNAIIFGDGNGVPHIFSVFYTTTSVICSDSKYSGTISGNLITISGLNKYSYENIIALQKIWE